MYTALHWLLLVDSSAALALVNAPWKQGRQLSFDRFEIGRDLKQNKTGVS